MSWQTTNKNRCSLFFAILIVGFMLVGCATPIYKMYPGPARPMEDLATVEITNVRVEVFDTSLFSGRIMEILPGKHYLRINHRSWYPYPDLIFSYTFTAKRGHLYRVGADYEAPDGLPYVPWILDVTDGIKVGSLIR